MTNPIIFVDTETTGLYVESGHEIWEWGSIRIEDWKTFEKWYWNFGLQSIEWQRRESKRIVNITEAVRTNQAICWELADPMAMQINGYFSRDSDTHWNAIDDRKFAQLIFHETYGCSWVGAIPSFDTRMAAEFLKMNDMMPYAWHYHLIDVESMVMGHLLGREDIDLDSLRLPMKYGDLQGLLSSGIQSLAMKVGKHTAFGDAFVVLVLYGWMNGLTNIMMWTVMWDFFKDQLNH